MANGKPSKTTKALKKTGRIVFSVIAAILFIVGAVCIGFSISWFVKGTNTAAAKIVILIIGAIALFLTFKLVQKIRDGIRREREKAVGHSSGNYAPSQPREPKANRTAGSEGELKRAVLNALPASGSYLGSWEHGEAYLRSVGVEIWTSARKVIIKGKVEYKIKAVEYYSESHIKDAAQSHLDSTASDLADRAAAAVEEYMYNYSGFDGDWSIQASGLSASFSS